MSSQAFDHPKCSSCPQVGELEKRVKELEEENKGLREKLAAKDEEIKYLWRKLRKYRNPHTPSSKRLGSSKSSSSDSGQGKRGAEEGLRWDF